MVCKNGASAYICDHAGLDGGTLLQLNQHLRRAILEYKPENPRLSVGTEKNKTLEARPSKAFVTNDLIDSYIVRTLQRFPSLTQKAELLNHSQDYFGSTFFRSHNCTPKSGFQLLIQLAALKYFGYQPPSWETVQMRVFNRGRAGMYQAVLPSVAAFCEAMEDKTSDPLGKPMVRNDQSHIRKMFNLAAKEHASLLATVHRGHGFTHHMYALQEVVRPDQGEVMPSLFTDPIYARTRPTKLMTDCQEWLGSIQEGGFAMPDPDFVLVHYEINEHG